MLCVPNLAPLWHTFWPAMLFSWPAPRRDNLLLYRADLSLDARVSTSILSFLSPCFHTKPHQYGVFLVSRHISMVSFECLVTSVWHDHLGSNRKPLQRGTLSKSATKWVKCSTNWVWWSCCGFQRPLQVGPNLIKYQMPSPCVSVDAQTGTQWCKVN